MTDKQFNDQGLPKSRRIQGIESLNLLSSLSQLTSFNFWNQLWIAAQKTELQCIAYPHVVNLGSFNKQSLTNWCINLRKSMYKFWQIHIATMTNVGKSMSTLRNPYINFTHVATQISRYIMFKDFDKIWQRALTDWQVADWQGKAMIELGSDSKKIRKKHKITRVIIYQRR